MNDLHRWSTLFDHEQRAWLTSRLLHYARPRRWFRTKSRAPRGAQVLDLVPLDAATRESATQVLAVLEVLFDETADLYVIPLAIETGAPPVGVIAPLDGTDRVLVDGLATGSVAQTLLSLMRDTAVRSGEFGQVQAESHPTLAPLATAPLPVKVHHAEQTNSTLVFGDRVLMKMYRQLTAGPNPEVEVGHFLTESCQPPCGAPLLGGLSYRDRRGNTFSLGVAHRFLSNQGDAWSVTLNALATFLKNTSGPAPTDVPFTSEGAALVEQAFSPPGPGAHWVGPYLASAATLGIRTGEIHAALASRPDLPDFAPEPLTDEDRKTLVSRARARLRVHLGALAGLRDRLSPDDRAIADVILDREETERILSLLAEFGDRAMTMQKMRIHGDLHLGQILARGDDFTIIDFEGEPARPLAERRAKTSPLRDVMGMVRSFDYAVAAALRSEARTPEAARWTDLWKSEVTAAYLRAYFSTVSKAGFLPQDQDALAVALTFYELEKVFYELGYELDNRPDWVGIPLSALARITGIEVDR